MKKEDVLFIIDGFNLYLDWVQDDLEKRDIEEALFDLANLRRHLMSQQNKVGGNV
jgi:hypothetical protein